MSTKKWLILIALGMAVCVTMVAILCFAWFFGLGNFKVGGWLPVYKIEQTASAHPGFLRTTVTSGTSVFVSDYDEYALQLQDVEPKNAIGRGPIGGKMVYTIPGKNRRTISPSMKAPRCRRMRSTVTVNSHRSTGVTRSSRQWSIPRR